MGKKFLIDSNVLIGYIGKTLPHNGQSFVTDIIDNSFNISFINKIEMLGHSSANAEITGFINLSNVYGATNAVIDTAIEIRKIYKIKLPDGIIAATALCFGFTLLSRNTSDFKNIKDLNMLNPWEV